MTEHKDTPGPPTEYHNIWSIVGHNIQVLKKHPKVIEFQNSERNCWFFFDLNCFILTKFRQRSFRAMIKCISILGNASDKKLQKFFDTKQSSFVSEKISRKKNSLVGWKCVRGRFFGSLIPSFEMDEWRHKMYLSHWPLFVFKAQKCINRDLWKRKLRREKQPKLRLFREK